MREYFEQMSVGELMDWITFAQERIDELERAKLQTMDPLHDLAMELVIRGRFIDAIREYRDANGCSLVDAKKKVDEFSEIIYNYRRNQ